MKRKMREYVLNYYKFLKIRFYENLGKLFRNNIGNVLK